MRYGKPLVALGALVLVSSCASIFGVSRPTKVTPAAATLRVAKPAKLRIAFVKPAPIHIPAAPKATAKIQPPVAAPSVVTPKIAAASEAPKPVITASIEPATPAPVAPSPDAAPTLSEVISDAKIAPPKITPPKITPPEIQATTLAPLTAMRPKPRNLKSRPAPVQIAKASTAKPKTAQAKSAQAPISKIKSAPLKSAPIRLARARVCSPKLSRGIRSRAMTAPSGSAFVRQAMALGGPTRDRAIEKQVLAGNVPAFLRKLVPVTLSGLDTRGAPVEITICVAPDYLAVGSNKDFVRVPMGLPATAEVVNRLGFILPTTKMVDAIYRQAGLHLAPSPMQAGRQMTSTDYLWRHNQTVEAQRAAANATRGELVAGQKKDIVLSNALLRTPGRVAIYGWHRLNGKPIQPLTTVHGERYADYSHGIRLVSETAYINGKPRALAKLLQDPKIASILSKEGPIKRPLRMMAALSAH